MQPCPGTCQPTVEHDVRARQSRARCWRCGAVAAPIAWAEDFPTQATRDACIDAFREEHHHAD